MPPSSAPWSNGGEQSVERFEAAWRTGTPPVLDDYLPPTGDPNRARALRELVITDLDYRWRTARKSPSATDPPPRLEEYLARYPELGPPERASADLIAEEYRVRRWWGGAADHAEYVARFPSQAPRLRMLLAQVDAELDEESRPEQPAPRPPGPSPEGKAPVYPTVAALIDNLRGLNLLSQNQLKQAEEAARCGNYPDARSLLRDLLERNWLTAFQANQLMHGRDAEQVVGPYQLLERLGEGGAGQVFKARHQKMSRVVALKLIRKELLADAEVLGRFYREIQVVSQLDHPNVVHAYDAGPAGSTHFLAMEYVEGTDLGQLVKRGGPLPVEQACAYIRQAALGLQHAHERGLVHRDIKPHNLILSVKEALIKVTDLGLARLARPANEEATAVLTGGIRSTGTLTPENAALIGTLDYLAPEQALDFHRADIRSDIYSLGCTLYYLLTGQPPFAGGTLAEKLIRHQQAEPPALEQFRRDVPADVRAVLGRMMAKRPEDRFQIPAEVAAALQSFLSGERAIPPPATRKGRRLAVALIAVLLLGGALIVMWKAPSGAVPPRTSPSRSDSEVLGGPFDQLDREHIPPEKRIVGLPEEVVAVLGTRHDKRQVSAVAFHPDGRRLAWAESGKVHLWDAQTGKEADGFPRDSVKHPSSPHPISQLAFSPDGKTLALTISARPFLWEVADPNDYPRPLPQDPGAMCVLAYSPNGSRLATSNGKTVTLWDPSNGKLLESISPPKAARSLSISPDGEILAVGGLDRVGLYSLKHTPAKLLRTVEKAWAPACLAPTKTRLLLAAQGGSSRLVLHWDLTTIPLESDRLPLPASFKIVAGADGFGLAYAPDGRYLAAARKNQLFVYDLESKETSYNPTLPCDSGRIAVAPDGRHLATANSDGTVYLLRLPGKRGR